MPSPLIQELKSPFLLEHYVGDRSKSPKQLRSFGFWEVQPKIISQTHYAKCHSPKLFNNRHKWVSLITQYQDNHNRVFGDLSICHPYSKRGGNEDGAQMRPHAIHAQQICETSMMACVTCIFCRKFGFLVIRAHSTYLSQTQGIQSALQDTQWEYFTKSNAFKKEIGSHSLLSIRPILCYCAKIGGQQRGVKKELLFCQVVPTTLIHLGNHETMTLIGFILIYVTCFVFVVPHVQTDFFQSLLVAMLTQHCSHFLRRIFSSTPLVCVALRLLFYETFPGPGGGGEDIFDLQGIYWLGLGFLSSWMFSKQRRQQM